MLQCTWRELSSCCVEVMVDSEMMALVEDSFPRPSLGRVCRWRSYGVGVVVFASSNVWAAKPKVSDRVSPNVARIATATSATSARSRPYSAIAAPRWPDAVTASCRRTLRASIALSLRIIRAAGQAHAVLYAIGRPVMVMSNYRQPAGRYRSLGLVNARVVEANKTRRCPAVGPGIVGCCCL